jgi:hypothetical protein
MDYYGYWDNQKIPLYCVMAKVFAYYHGSADAQIETKYIYNLTENTLYFYYEISYIINF